MTRFTPSLIALLALAPALAGCASTGGLFGSSDAHKKAAVASNAGSDAAKASETANLPTDIESGVRQAREKRLAGQYDDAIRILSQLMLVASDDHRVVSEYGKTLAENGRAQEAVQFLTRAVALQPAEWSYYSALGVAYDQVGDQNAARTAYERALRLRPGDAAILNNYALSRMLANDPEGARALMARAEKAGGASDPKIARNIELVNKVAPPALKTAADMAQAEHAPASMPTPVSSESLPAPSNQNASASAKGEVVMQPVPSDPLAGPSKPANHASSPLATHVAKTAAPKPNVKLAHGNDEKPVTAAKADAPKPDTKTAKADVKAGKPEVPSLRTAKPDSKDVKAAEAKPDTKAPAKPATKNGIPELRQTASAY
jgi:Flp pilus assembly protein TadD